MINAAVTNPNRVLCVVGFISAILFITEALRRSRANTTGSSGPLVLQVSWGNFPMQFGNQLYKLL
jgi:hypothetical protein